MTLHICGHSPCCGCSERKPPDCHVWCEKYAEWVKKKDSLALSNVRGKDAQNYLTINRISRANRFQRWFRDGVRINDVWGR